jgi:alpha-ketoglutarate-dependent taurine dioxygenase
MSTEALTFITVGGKRFHYIWLRDHCLCPACHYPESFQKLYDVSLHGAPAAPLAVEEIDGELHLVWDEEPPHRSIFPIDWLHRHAYDPNPAPQRRHERILWDNAQLESNLATWPNTRMSGFDDWADQLLSLGFTILRHLTLDTLHALLDSIGPRHPTEYGSTPSRVKPIPGSTDLSLSAAGYALPPHTDGSYRQGENLLQYLYACENTTVGGESILVDGFRVAHEVRRHHPEAFRLLTDTSVQFRQFDSHIGYFLCHTTPIIKLDPSGDFEAVYFSHKNSSWHLSFDEMEPFYQAYCTFARYLHDPTYQYRIRLDSGDCLLTQNARVLHGRTAYEPHTGYRELEAGYISWIYVHGRRDYPHFHAQFLGEGAIQPGHQPA